MDLDQEFNYLLRGKDHDHEQEIIEDLREKFNYFKDLKPLKTSAEFSNWMNSSTPEDQVPKMWNDSNEMKEVVSMRELMLVKSFRADRLVQAASKFVMTVLGPGFNSEKELDLAYVVENEVNANTPILMCSVSGFDASGNRFALFLCGYQSRVLICDWYS